MAAKILDGEALAARLRQDIAERRAKAGIVPRLVMVLLGEDPASRAYLARKAADCAQVGMAASLLTLPAQTTRDQLLAEVARLNADVEVDGFFVQFPLPEGHDPAEVSALIDAAKDVDGLSPLNLYRLTTGTPGLSPCTPAGILALLRHYGLPLQGASVTILGRGPLVGRPLALMLSAPKVGARVTLLHSHSGEIARHCRDADILISATGCPGLIRPDWVRPGAAVIGAGIAYDGAGKMLSDIGDGVAEVAGYLTPSPRAVGALTRAMLLENLLTAALARRSRIPG